MSNLQILSLLKEIPLKSEILMGFHPSKREIDNYMKSVSIDNYKPVIKSPVTSEIIKISMDINKYRDMVISHIQNNGLELKFQQLERVLPSRIVIALTTGYLNPLFSYEDYIHRGALEKIVLQRKMELSSNNINALRYAQKITKNIRTFKAFLNETETVVRNYILINGSPFSYRFTSIDLSTFGEQINQRMLDLMIESSNVEDIRELKIHSNVNIPELPNLISFETNNNIPGDIPSVKSLVLKSKPVINPLLYTHLDSLTVDSINLNLTPALFNLSSINIMNVNPGIDLLPIFQIPLLQRIKLKGSPQFPQLESIGSAKQLVEISIENMRVTTVTLSKMCKKLVKLELTNCEGITSSSIKYLSNFNKLSKLEVVSKNYLTGQGEIFHYITHLRSLKLSYPTDSNEFLSVYNLQTLENLDLSDSNVNDSALKYISGLTRIRKINLSGTMITEKGLYQLFHKRNGYPLEHLDISKTKVRTLYPKMDKEIYSLNASECLELNEHKILPIRGLKKLNLSNAGVSSVKIMPQIKNQVELTDLKLEGVNVADEEVEKYLSKHINLINLTI